MSTEHQQYSLETKLCAGIVLVEGRHDVYVDYHNLVVESRRAVRARFGGAVD